MTMSFPGTTPQTRSPVRALMLCLAVILAANLSGCSDKEATQPFSAPATASQVGATTPTLRTSVAMGRVVGRLPAQRRKSVRQQVTVVIDRWWEAAYLTGARPGADLGSAFPGFTGGARSRARADRELMTNANLSFSSITPLMRDVHLDLLAVNKHARSITARFNLRLRVTQTNPQASPQINTQASVKARRLQIRGRLFLTRRPAGWQVFGYDVSKGWL